MESPKIITNFDALDGRVLLFGGSFDPVQNAHLAIAKRVSEELKLDHIVFIPAYQNPLKSRNPVSGELRLKMIEKAILSEANFRVSDIELKRGEENGRPSYAIETAAAVRAQLPKGSTLFFLIGSDNLRELHRWADIHTLIKNLNFVIVPREQNFSRDQIAARVSNFSESEINRLKEFYVDMPPIAISSTEIRTALAESEVPGAWLPEGVLEIISRHNLYRR